MQLKYFKLFFLTYFFASICFAEDKIPNNLTKEDVLRASAGCKDCHVKTDAESMHENPAVQIACVNCHGGNANIRLPKGITKGNSEYEEIRKAAHILPRHLENWPTAGNPQNSYANILKESAEFVKFINIG